jgi:hypothetical protein
MNRFIHLQLSIAAVLLAILCFGCGTEPVQPLGTAGKVKLDKSAYSGVVKTMTITLTDPDLTAGIDSVTVSSSAYPAGIIVKLTAANGVYSGTVGFSTENSGSGTLLVADGSVITVTYNDLLPKAAVTATAKWKATATGLTLDAASYQGVVKPMTITLVDSSASVPSLDVKVFTAKTKSLPLTLTLSAVAGSVAQYAGAIKFSTEMASADTILVKDMDTVFVTFDAGSPSGVVTAKAVWNGTPGTLTLDTTAFTGTAKKMTVTVVDPDLRITKPVVTVKSGKDSTGIKITLKPDGKTAGTFVGMVGFSFAKSSDSAIAVADSNTVTVTYNDLSPVAAVSKTATWYAGMIQGLGIFGAGVTPGSQINPAFTTTLFTWAGTCTVDSTPGFNGTSNAVRITAGAAGWAGFGWAQTNAGTLSSLDMTAFAACTLHVSMKGNAAGIKILVENQTHTAQTFIQTTDYGYAGDEQWHDVAIPLSAWAATCDLSGVAYYLGATFDPFTGGTYIILDKVYWTLPVKP